MSNVWLKIFYYFILLLSSLHFFPSSPPSISSIHLLSSFRPFFSSLSLISHTSLFYFHYLLSLRFVISNHSLILSRPLTLIILLTLIPLSYYSIISFVLSFLLFPLYVLFIHFLSLLLSSFHSFPPAFPPFIHQSFLHLYIILHPLITFVCLQLSVHNFNNTYNQHIFPHISNPPIN